MLDHLSNEPVAVSDHASVDLLMNLGAIRRLAPFMHAEHTLGSAAKSANVPASSLAYWVQRFLTTGLLEITRVQPRAGKPIPHYRAISSRFHVPFAAMPAGTRDEFLLRGRKSAFEQFIAASNHAAEAYFDAGLSIAAHEEHGVELNFIEPTDGRTSLSVEWWGHCSLTDEEAAEVRRTLAELQTRLGRGGDGPGRTRYQVVLGFAPALRA